ncbi:MAG: hypothetical protein IRZ05_10815 [Micromonosporaceae bacterium]|nr:hypothetical protein [Micromonosporaceae bacterium]
MITLPVSVVVGDHPMPVGELEDGERVAPALAALFRAAADELDLDAQEVSPHGTAK